MVQMATFNIYFFLKKYENTYFYHNCNGGFVMAEKY